MDPVRFINSPVQPGMIYVKCPTARPYPPTGDRTPFALYALLIVCAVTGGIWTLRKKEG